MQKNIINSGDAYDRYEYNRSSSMACALHIILRDKLYSPEYYYQRAEKELYKNQEYMSLSPEEKAVQLEKTIKRIKKDLDHYRWLAYMWAEGYKLGLYKSTIAKTHAGLVSLDERDSRDKSVSQFMYGSSSGEKGSASNGPDQKQQGKKEKKKK